MDPRVPHILDTLTAVISLACRGGEELRIHRIYSVINELKGREALLSGLYFSIIGAVCYSRQIDEALRSLVTRGILAPKDRDTLVVRDEAAVEIRDRLRRRLPASAYRALKNASRKFHEKMIRSDEKHGQGGWDG